MKKSSSPLNPASVFVLACGLGLGFALVAARFYTLQVTEYPLWKKKAAAQQEQRVDIAPRRGAFYGKIPQGEGTEYVCLVQDIACHHLYVDAKAIPFFYKRALADLLEPITKKSSNELFAQISKNSRFRKLVCGLSQKQKKEIEEAFSAFIKQKKIPKNALFFLSGYQRAYPMGSMAGSLFHTLGVQEGHRGPERVPSGGLEKKLDGFLKGKAGKLVYHKTPKGRLDATRMIKTSEPGADVYLTLNPLIQTVVETELKEAVTRAKARGGWAIVMEPYTGEIMAWAQAPSLDLKDPHGWMAIKENREYLQLKALTDPFEPGSIMKPITMLVCLKAKALAESQKKGALFNPDEKIACTDGRFPGRKNPIKDVHVYPYLNMDMAIQKSSNIYMGRSIQKVLAQFGESFYYNELKETFGFGKKTGISLLPESGGYLPTPGKKDKKGRYEWSVPTPFSLAMGYNLLATSLQMTRVFAMIANGGLDVEPYLVEKIVRKKSSGLDDILYDHGSIQKPSHRLIDKALVEKIKHAMRYAVNRGGTASRAHIPGYSACGKTATTEKLSGGFYSHEKHISTFVGFAPMSRPRFVCLIVIDEPLKMIIPGVGKNQFGGVCAAPSFAKIGQKTLEILGEAPDDPMDLDPKEKSPFKLELEGLEKLFKSWNH